MWMERFDIGPKKGIKRGNVGFRAICLQVTVLLALLRRRVVASEYYTNRMLGLAALTSDKNAKSYFIGSIIWGI